MKLAVEKARIALCSEDGGGMGTDVSFVFADRTLFIGKKTIRRIIIGITLDYRPLASSPRV